jgi:hypothetical protein
VLFCVHQGRSRRHIEKDYVTKFLFAREKQARLAFPGFRFDVRMGLVLPALQAKIPGHLKDLGNLFSAFLTHDIGRI